MDKQAPTNGHVEPGISLLNGPMEGVESTAQTNGVSKRKASMRRSYKQDSDSDDAPLVRSLITTHRLRGLD